MTTAPRALRLGTRGSALALAQARSVRDGLRAARPDLRVEIVIIRTVGDRVQDRPLHRVGGTGLFTREIERALRDGAIDVAVHSLKDLPAVMRDGLALGAVPPREDPRDALICPAGHTLEALPEGARIATGALRRRAQLLHARPDLRLTGLRGNLDTRLRKVRERPDLDATLVAAAGLARMGWLHRATELLDVERFVPAGGQGAIGVQVRAGDDRTRELVAALDDPPTATRTAAERAFLERLGAGCQVPVGVHARLQGATLTVDGVLAGMDGTPYLRHRVTGDAADPRAAGRAVADRLIADGGDELRRILPDGGIE